MREVENSDFTQDIWGPQTNNINESIQPTSSGCLRCPICGEFKSRSEIEDHGVMCAQSKFPQIISISDDDVDTDAEDESDGESLLKPFEKDSNSVKSLKEVIGEPISNTKSLKVKVRRGNAFNDFCCKIQKPWIKKLIGMPLYVEFIGESGIDNKL